MINYKALYKVLRDGSLHPSIWEETNLLFTLQRKDIILSTLRFLLLFT